MTHCHKLEPWSHPLDPFRCQRQTRQKSQDVRSLGSVEMCWVLQETLPLSFQLLCALSRLSSHWSQDKGHRMKTATSTVVQANFSNNFPAPIKLRKMPQFAHCPWWFALKPAKQSGFSKGPRHPHDRYVPARNMCRKYKVKSASALAEMACRVVTAPSRTEASKSAFAHPNLGNGPAIWEPVSPPPSNRSVLSAAPETCKLQPSKLHSTKSMVSKVSFSKDARHGTIFETSPISKD